MYACLCYNYSVSGVLHIKLANFSDFLESRPGKPEITLKIPDFLRKKKIIITCCTTGRSLIGTRGHRTCSTADGGYWGYGVGSSSCSSRHGGRISQWGERICGVVRGHIIAEWVSEIARNINRKSEIYIIDTQNILCIDSRVTFKIKDQEFQF